jgi:hypothetical protein
MKGHSMSKKDYELIARVLRFQRNHIVTSDEAIDQVDQLAAMFATELASTNPRFDRERFIAACMGEDSHDSAGRKVRYSTDSLAGQRS